MEISNMNPRNPTTNPIVSTDSFTIKNAAGEVTWIPASALPVFVSTGLNGWSPVFATELNNLVDPNYWVLKVIDWVGGGGVKPVVNVYIGLDGFTTNIEEATPVSGTAGLTPEFRFNSGFLQYQYIGQDSQWQNLIAQSALTGPPGEEGPPNPNATNLNGEPGAFYLNRDNHQGTQAPSTIVQDSSNRFSTDTEKAGWNSKQDALGFTPEDSANKGVAGGYAPLGGDIKISSAYLPSYVDDVLEFANLASFPLTGDTGKIYVALDTNFTYRWGGSSYVEISSGAVQSVNGQTGVVNLTKSNIGLANVDNTSDSAKPISTATQTALNAKENTITPGTVDQYIRGNKTLGNFPRYEVLAELPADLSGYPDGSEIVVPEP
jgi:hypothetical protein